MRDGAPWCTLCLTPTASPEPEPAAAAPAIAPVTAPADLPAATPPTLPVPGGWPCSACGHPNPLGLSACAVCGSGFLARLAAEDAPSLVLPLVGDMRTLSRSHHLALAGAVLTGVLAVLVLSACLGMLLG